MLTPDLEGTSLKVRMGEKGKGGKRRCPVMLASLVAQMVKNLCAIQEAWVRSLGWEDPLKKGIATHSRILAWRTPWTDHGITQSQT